MLTGELIDEGIIICFMLLKLMAAHYLDPTNKFLLFTVIFFCCEGITYKAKSILAF